jgi:hypothetical protein
MTDTAPSDHARARRRCVERFNAGSWLRSIRVAEEDAPYLATTTGHCVSPQVRLIFEPPKLDSPKVQNFLSEQEFEGFVLSVDTVAQTFWARLADRTSGTADEEAELPFVAISSDDWPLIVRGAQFSWNIGREWRDGQVRYASDIRFRRCFRSYEAAVAKAKLRASALSDLLAEATAYPASDFPQTRRD